MKLLKLSSSNSGFRTLVFKEGLNVLAGLQLTSSEKKTYNGIGKSFSLKLIHLMLGSRLEKAKQQDKKVHDFLVGYGTFYLELVHRNLSYNIEKDFSTNYYILNGEKLSQAAYSAELKKQLIGSGFDENISFKQLLNVFARRYGGAYYSECVTQQGMPPTDYNQMYVNLKLLGVDTDLVIQKYNVKSKLGRLEKARKAVEGLESILVDANVKDLKEQLDELEEQRDNFIIAENYDSFKLEADSITNEINIIRNEIYASKNKILRKYKSIEQAKFIDVDLSKIKHVYDEANFFLDEKISVRLDEAKEFHQKLMESRLSRLESEIDELKGFIHTLYESLLKKEKYRDSILKDLNSQGALEEYNSINERVRTLDQEIQELERHKKILEEFKQEESALGLENAKIKAESIRYLNESKSQLEVLENKFRELVKKFYRNHGGSFQIKSTSDARYLFNIDAHVPRDGSQGVNEVKVFCYDFLLYLLNPNLLGFLAHDGCIFSEMDPRQKSMIFKVALEIINSSDLQYFVNIGESSLNEVLDSENKIGILSDEEKENISESVILELYDKDPSKWLFGMSFG